MYTKWHFQNDMTSNTLQIVRSIRPYKFPNMVIHMLMSHCPIQSTQSNHTFRSKIKRSTPHLDSYGALDPTNFWVGLYTCWCLIDPSRPYGATTCGSKTNRSYSATQTCEKDELVSPLTCLTTVHVAKILGSVEPCGKCLLVLM